MTYAELLGRFRGIRALVVGDLMLDAYIFGTAERISPEAPVMVIRKIRESEVPGGGANVARNLTALGASVAVVGLVGDDHAGTKLRSELGSDGIVIDPSRPTTCKTRVVADHAHQVLRIDEESSEEPSELIESQLIDRALNALSNCDVVLLSDYLKGTLSERVVRSIIDQARVPVVANPKPRTVNRYSGAMLVSLNRTELSQFMGHHTPAHDQLAESLAESARKRLNVQALMATLGAGGMFIASNQDSFRIPVDRVEVYDTAGAGDTAIATAALGVAAAGIVPEVFQLAARTSSAVVRHVGVVVPSETDLAHIRNS